MRLRLLLAYVGTRYHGWQIQGADLARHTVQGVLEAALSRLAGVEVRAFGSGRTDAGVHAEGQVVHCDIPDDRAGRIADWRHALNALLPDDIQVLEARQAADDFHARIHALDKTYRYCFWQERGFVPPRLRPFVWRCGPLDVDAMREAAALLVGTHDFAAFANAGTEVAGTVRTLTAIEIEEAAGEATWPPCLPLLVMTVTGTGFLKQMVRNMAGLLAEVGRGKVTAADVEGLLAAGRRSALPSATAPAGGLTLLRVRYGKEGTMKAGLTFAQALGRARKGERMTRPSWGERFFAIVDGRLLAGAPLGESSFMDMHAWTPGAVDRDACDWRPYRRTEYDPWEGCELPQGPGRQRR